MPKLRQPVEKGEGIIETLAILTFVSFSLAPIDGVIPKERHKPRDFQDFVLKMRINIAQICRDRLAAVIDLFFHRMGI
jgi:hypothetical protein